MCVYVCERARVCIGVFEEVGGIFFGGGVCGEREKLIEGWGTNLSLSSTYPPSASLTLAKHISPTDQNIIPLLQFVNILTSHPKTSG